MYTGKQMYTHWQGPGNYILHLVQPTKVSFHFRAMKTDKVLRCYNLTTHAAAEDAAKAEGVKKLA